MPRVPDPRTRRPILVTGVPRSGTTWLARWLAAGTGMALAGREPMNPRGRQYALAGTLPGWARLTAPTSRQRRALVTAYRGLNPWVYSRYGTRQWAAPLPWTRLVIKDPFALLSMPAIAEQTGALPVLVYRHPGAVLASYRRMGWTPDLTELQAVLEAARATGGPGLPDLAPDLDPGSAVAMGRFWATLHDLALADLDATGTDAVVVAHHELASSGPSGGRRFADRVGVGWTADMEQELARESGGPSGPGGGDGGSAAALHNLDRAPAEVAEAWRRTLDPAEVDDIERVTGSTRSALDARRFPLTG
jgi:hypothetical protein